MFKNTVRAGGGALVLVFMIAAFGQPANAEEDYRMTPLDCERIEVVARLIMEMRQDGVPYHVAVNGVRDELLGLALVNVAYDVPVFKSQAKKQKAIKFFKDKLKKVCRQDIDK